MFKIKGKYTEALITNDNTDPEVVQQIQSITNNKAYAGCKIVELPDGHLGKINAPVGFCSELGDYVNPCTVGVDIGCEISMHQYDKPLPEDKYEDLNRRIINSCGWGFNLSPEKVYDDEELYSFFSQEFRKAKKAKPEIFGPLPDTVTREWVSETLIRIGMNENTWYGSINSFGGGNHFCEYDESEDKTKCGITVHCGSRNFGLKVCKYWENVAKKSPLSKNEIKDMTNRFKATYMKEHGDMRNFKPALDEYIEGFRKGHIDGFLSGENMKGYFRDMLFAMAYARFNHMVIHRVIDGFMEEYGCKCIGEIISTHNYIDFTGEKPLIRKGAIRAFAGEEMLVPFNMRDGVAVCEGLSNGEWLNSCAHGAGRKMSRTKAKANVKMDEFQKSMEGIYSTTVCTGTLDESPMAYKDTNEIMDLIKNTCVIKYMMKPRINIKAVDGGE